MKLLDRLLKKKRNSKSELALRRTSSISVKDVLDHFAPERAGSTGAQLVSFGPRDYFLVIQGPEAQWLTDEILAYIDALHARRKSDDHSD